MKKVTDTVLAIALTLLAGCTTLDQDMSKYRAAKKPTDLKEKQEIILPKHTKKELVREDHFVKYEIDFGSGKLIEYNVGSDDWMILYPVLASEETPVCRYFAHEFFMPEGINVLIIPGEPMIDPEHYRPLEGKDSADEHLNDVIKESMYAVSYLKEQGADKIGVMGFSLGGLRAIGAAPYIQPDITVVGMSGGGLDTIIMESVEPLVEGYRNFLIEKYGSKDEVVKRLQRLGSEPLKHAQFHDPNNVKQVVTKDDTSVPTSTQWALHDALGSPEAYVVPGGHYPGWKMLCIERFVVNRVLESFNDEN